MIGLVFIGTFSQLARIEFLSSGDIVEGTRAALDGKQVIP